ncbi:MAG: hypothetical protein JXA21_22855 [Anaerolineae bacterium]|nr:hypothetical protein [Anaerolineae bacterium]
MSDIDSDDAGMIIEIQDPEIDAEAIMRQIRENIHQRRIRAETEGMDYASLASGTYAARFDENLYLALRQLETSPYARPGVSLAMAKTAAIPVFGALVQRVRAALHQLVIYYVNILAEQQRSFNVHVIRTFKAMVKELEKEPLPDELAILREEVTQLREQVKRLEAGKERSES